MNNKNDNKGFTLIELIISMSILSIVLVMGYNIINKNNIFTNTQQDITNNQSIANLVNIYFSKDIEESKNISGKETIDKNIYRYTITKESETVEYKITLVNKNGKEAYSLLRSDGKSSVEIISNQIRNNEEPFLINPKINGTYEVKISYSENNKPKEYSFDIASRLSANNTGSGSGSGGEDEDNGNNSGGMKPSPEDIPSLPSEVGPNTHYIGFWMADYNIQKENNVYTWIDNKFAKGISNKEENNISADIRPGNHGDSEFACVDNTKVTGAITEKSDVEFLSIYVSKGTKVEDFEIKSGQDSSSITILNNTTRYNTSAKMNLSGGANDGKWYTCQVSGDINTFEINSGKLSINKSIVNSGYVLIVYSEAPKNLGDADIIFEYQRNYEDPMNSNQFNMTNNIKVKSNFNYYETVDSKKDNAFNGSIQTRISNYTHESSPNILLMTEKSSDRRIYSIYNKNIKQTKKAILTLEGNISIDDKSGLTEIIPNKQYEFNFPSGVNFDRYINISKLEKGETGILKVNLLVD